MSHGKFAELMMMQKQAVDSMAEKVDYSRIQEIDPDIYVYYNSVNIFNGPQGTGKTYSAMQEILKIDKVCPRTHLLVYISQYGEETDDPTIEGSIKLLKMPVVRWKYSECEEKLQKLLCYKRLYHDIVNQGIPFDEIEDDQQEELKEELHIDNFNRQNLHTLILFDDAADNKLFRDGSYLSKMIAICRKIFCTFFLTIQKWRGVSTCIRANTTCAFVMGGFSRQQLKLMLQQVASKADSEYVCEVYKGLDVSDKIVVNNRTGNVQVIKAFMKNNKNNFYKDGNKYDENKYDNHKVEIKLKKKVDRRCENRFVSSSDSDSFDSFNSDCSF